MTGTIEQFVPRHDARINMLDPDGWREALMIARPDLTEEQIDGQMALFTAMKERVDYPRRRFPGGMRRAGPVLFDPYHSIREAPGEETTQ